MSKEVVVGLKIGASTTSSVGKVLRSTTQSVTKIGTSARSVTIIQRQLGQAMTAGLTRVNAVALRTRSAYDSLKQSITKARSAHALFLSTASAGNNLINKTQENWGKLIGTAMAAIATIKTVMATAGQAMSFQDTLRDIRINGNLNSEEELRLGNSIQSAVSTTNQDRDSLAAGANKLVSDGVSVDEVTAQLVLMGNTMTALRLSSDTAAGAMLALRDMGVEDDASMRKNLDVLIGIGKQGSFSPQMMISTFAELGDTIKASGLKGDQAIADMAAGLQVAEGSMGGDAAKAGLQSWLTSMGDKRINEAYKNAGVDYSKSMALMTASGMNEYQASLEIAGNFIKDKLSEKDRQALLSGDDDGKIASMLQQMGMGEVFKDINAARFALSVNNNKTDVQSMANGNNAGSLDALATLRKESPAEQMKSLQLSINELALDIGTVLLPPLLDLVQGIKPVVTNIREFTQANPLLIKTLAGVLGLVVGLKVASVGAGLGFDLFSGIFKNMSSIFKLASPIFSSVIKVLGGPLVSALRIAGQVILWLGRALMMNPIGLLVTGIAVAAYLIYEYWEPIKKFFVGIWDEAKTAFSGGITGISTFILNWSPIGLFYRAFAGVMSYFGVDLPSNFTEFGSMIISSLINGISNMAGTVYALAVNIWNEVKTAFSGGISGIATLITNWSPLGLFYRAFAGVMSYFGVDLPSNFTEFGSMIVSGLINGISNMAGAVKDAIVGLGDGVSGWFKETLGINSPSKVFTELGAGVPEGAALGITESSGLVRDATLGMAQQTDVDLFPPTMIGSTSSDAFITKPVSQASISSVPDVPARFTSGADRSSSTSSLVVNFSPTLQVQGGEENIKSQIQEGLKIGFVEFEKMMRTYQERIERRSYTT